jgi:4-azaleucine resistance transporter AzlC
MDVRSLFRTIDRGLLRDVVAIATAVGFVGLSYGAIAVASGLPKWAVVCMSLFVFAGGSQFMAVGLLAAGSPVAAVVGGLLLNARHFPFGLAVADVLAGSWGKRLVGAHLMVDESVAFALAQPDRPRRIHAYWLTGALLFTLWQLGTWVGIGIGSSVGDPARFGLDAAFPAALLALLMPRFAERDVVRVAVVGGAVAVTASMLHLPAGLPILLALAGLAAAGRTVRVAA